MLKYLATLIFLAPFVATTAFADEDCILTTAETIDESKYEPESEARDRINEGEPFTVEVHVPAGESYTADLEWGVVELARQMCVSMEHGGADHLSGPGRIKLGSVHSNTGPSYCYAEHKFQCTE